MAPSYKVYFSVLFGTLATHVLSTDTSAPAALHDELMQAAAAADDECGAGSEVEEERAACNLGLLQLRGTTSDASASIASAATGADTQADASHDNIDDVLDKPEAGLLNLKTQMTRMWRQVPPTCTWMPWLPNCYVPKHIGGVMTLYHQTSMDIGPKILKEGFRPGKSGFCGGAIYFASNPAATYTKALGPQSHQGYIIEAKVDMGRVKFVKGWCDNHMTREKLKQEGFDSITFNPGDGEEFVIYSPRRVKSMRHFK